MYKFTNATPKEVFISNAEWCGQKIKRIKSPIKTQRKWSVTDRWGNEWIVVFKGNVSEFSVYNVVKHHSDVPFSVDIVTYGNKIEIHKATTGGRVMQADRLLKKYSQLAMMVNCYLQFGYLND